MVEERGGGFEEFVQECKSLSDLIQPVFDDADEEQESDCDYCGEESFRVVNRSLDRSQVYEDEMGLQANN